MTDRKVLCRRARSFYWRIYRLQVSVVIQSRKLQSFSRCPAVTSYHLLTIPAHSSIVASLHSLLLTSQIRNRKLSDDYIVDHPELLAVDIFKPAIKLDGQDLLLVGNAGIVRGKFIRLHGT